ncbi:LCP family protein [Streptomyces taklimakanensis]|uniref:LCP family protein n=1 Tax=Streptomyces taklimakanensis TaxID=2569853 RepID=UPI003B75C042
MTEPEGTHQAEHRSEDGPSLRPRRLLRWAALGASLLVLTAGGAAWYLYDRLDGNIRTDVDAVNQLRRFEEQRPSPVAHEARNILLIGSDDRSGDNGRYGRDNGTRRSDTTILLHLSADRSRATGVSIPRDLMVDVPECEQPDGTTTEPRFAQFNWAFGLGGTACTVRTVEELTGIRVDHHLVVDFTGFEKLVDAVGGVEVCLAEPVDDPDAHLVLDAGPQRLDGEQALGYVRARKGIGDGSDTQRMARQQDFLKSLLHEVRDDGILTDPTKLYRVLDAVTSSLVADPGLDSLTELYDLARSVRDLPQDRVRFLTAPRRPYTYDPNRDELVQPDADRLFAALRDDRPVPEDLLTGSSPDGPTDEPVTGSPDEPAAEPSGAPSGEPASRGAVRVREATAEPGTGPAASKTGVTVPGDGTGSPSASPSVSSSVGGVCG